METYILKSFLCLVVFYGFYKLFLENESFHNFKRFYLLASVVLAFIIPLITFTEYREIVTQEVPILSSEISQIKETQTNYFPVILWCIYALGVLLFSFKFLKNLLGLVLKIKKNPKFKTHNFINVLLLDLVIPHTFLSYIFLNKQKFELQQIPKEVLLHEETHAKQKHSLDVLFIEIIQILFWFNPIVYLMKRSIKLNHEFLADQSVIKNGNSISTYQKILLAFSSNASEPQLANAINYSSIKKRFTIMKTQTSSKQNFWIRSFILLPLLAILIYSFSNKLVVSNQQKATPEEIAEYNQLAKKYNSMSESGEFIVKSIEKERLEYLYNKLSDLQRKNAEPFPVFPPPPPPPPAPIVMQGDNTNIPPPPPPAKLETQNPSKELLEAKKKYDEKANNYAKAMQTYFKGKKGNLSDLKKMYDDTMILYSIYSKLSEKELENPKD